MTTSNIPLVSEDLIYTVERNNINFNRLPVATDTGSLPYDFYDIKIKSNELINSRNINNSFEKIYANLTYIISRCFILNNSIPQSYLGIQPLSNSRFKSANGIAICNLDNQDNAIGFISSKTTVGILSGYYVDYSCETLNGGCFLLDGQDQTLSRLEPLVDNYSPTGTGDLLHINTSSVNSLSLPAEGVYDSQEFQPDICGGCSDETVFRSLVLSDDPTHQNVLSNTQDYKFSNIIDMDSERESNSLFILDGDMQTVFAYDTTGYLTGDQIFIKRNPAGRVYRGQIGGTTDSVLKTPKAISATNNRLYVFESGTSTSSPAVKEFDADSLALRESINLHYTDDTIDTVNHDVIAGVVSNDVVYTILKDIDSVLDYKILIYNILTGDIEIHKFNFFLKETPKQFKLSQNNPDIAYILTDKNIIKIHLSSPITPIGKFRLEIVEDMPSESVRTLNSLFVKKYLDTNNTDEIFVTVKGQDILYRFIDSHNFITNLQEAFEDDLYGLPAIEIQQDEYVNSFVYNNALDRLLNDHLAIVNNLRGKFISEEATSDRTGFTYFSTADTLESLGIKDIINDIKRDINIGINEFVLAETINRGLKQLYKLQESLFNIIEFDPTENVDTQAVVFNCSGLIKRQKDQPNIEVPVIINTDPTTCTYSTRIQFLINNQHNFNINIPGGYSINNNNYRDISTRETEVISSMVPLVDPIDEGAYPHHYFSAPLSTDETGKQDLYITRTLGVDERLISYSVTDIPSTSLSFITISISWYNADFSSHLAGDWLVEHAYMDSLFKPFIVEVDRLNSDKSFMQVNKQQLSGEEHVNVIAGHRETVDSELSYDKILNDSAVTRVANSSRGQFSIFSTAISTGIFTDISCGKVKDINLIPYTPPTVTGPVPTPAPDPVPTPTTTFDINNIDLSNYNWCTGASSDYDIYMYKVTSTNHTDYDYVLAQTCEYPGLTLRDVKARPEGILYAINSNAHDGKAKLTSQAVPGMEFKRWLGEGIITMTSAGVPDVEDKFPIFLSDSREYNKKQRAGIATPIREWIRKNGSIAYGSDVIGTRGFMSIDWYGNSDVKTVKSGAHAKAIGNITERWDLVRIYSLRLSNEHYRLPRGVEGVLRTS